MGSKKHWRLYQREGTAVWWVRMYIGGQLIRRTTGEADAPAAEIEAGKIWVAESTRAGQPVPAEVRSELARLTVEDAAAAWLVHLNAHKDEHREQYVSRYEADLCYIIPRWTFVDAINTTTWEQAKLDLHKPKGPLGWRSIQHLCVTLRALVRFCCTELKAIESVPELRPPAAKLVRKEKQKRRPFTTEQREAFLSALKDYHVTIDGDSVRDTNGKLLRGRAAQIAKQLPDGTPWRYYQTLFFTLLRRGEAAALAPWWVSEKAMTITVPPDHSKTGEEEVIPLHPRAWEAIKGQMAAKGSIDRKLPLFGKADGTPHDFRHAFLWALAKAGIEQDEPEGRIVPNHSTRHTAGTMLSEGGDREALKKAGRWNSNAVDDYLHTNVERARTLMLERL